MRECWTFRAVDTLFFRDGTPFQQGEQGSSYPKSHFPPTFMTLQGAIRATLARRTGWSPGGKCKWPEELGTPDDLGQLHLEGPYLQYQGKRLYPAPFVLFGKLGRESLTRLFLGKPVDCDLGEQIRLPQLPSGKKGAPLQVWLTCEGMEAVLNGNIPSEDQIYQPEDLWQEEQRVGISRDNRTRRVEEGQLYSITHVRPHSDLQVVIEVDGVPDTWDTIEHDIIPLGGEGRFASVEISQGSENRYLPAMPKLDISPDGSVLFTVSLLSPSYFQNLKQAIEKGKLEVPSEILGTFVSASMGKVIQVGGWDLVNRQSRPLKPLLPGGSTWFFKGDQEHLKEIAALHGTFCGLEGLWGCGKMVIGKWKEQGGIGR